MDRGILSREGRRRWEGMGTGGRGSAADEEHMIGRLGHRRRIDGTKSPFWGWGWWGVGRQFIT